MLGCSPLTQGGGIIKKFIIFLLFLLLLMILSSVQNIDIVINIFN